MHTIKHIHIGKSVMLDNLIQWWLMTSGIGEADFVVTKIFNLWDTKMNDFFCSTSWNMCMIPKILLKITTKQSNSNPLILFNKSPLCLSEAWLAFGLFKISVTTSFKESQLLFITLKIIITEIGILPTTVLASIGRMVEKWRQMVL